MIRCKVSRRDARRPGVYIIHYSAARNSSDRAENFFPPPHPAPSALGPGFSAQFPAELDTRFSISWPETNARLLLRLKTAIHAACFRFGLSRTFSGSADCIARKRDERECSFALIVSRLPKFNFKRVGARVRHSEKEWRNVKRWIGVSRLNEHEGQTRYRSQYRDLQAGKECSLNPITQSFVVRKLERSSSPPSSADRTRR